MWKRFYAGQTADVDENSPWSDILLKLNLSYEQSVALGKDAIQKCSPFSFEEYLYLRQLPLYHKVKQLAASLPNSKYGDYFYAVLQDACKIYFVRYPKLCELNFMKSTKQAFHNSWTATDCFSSVLNSLTKTVKLCRFSSTSLKI